jgi:hypothetical protein
LGNAITSNSPAEYHNHRFGCAWGGVLNTKYGYPCNIHVVKIKGIDQATFHQNCQLVDLLMGNGIQFPGDYQNSVFRPVFINAALMFYRDWLNQESYLLNDNTWYFYCAANKLTVLNIAANLPHNEAAFKEVYGDQEGSLLWKKFLDRYTNATGFDFYYYPNQETSFTPLWKLEGLEKSDITPLTKEEYDALDQHIRLGSEYKGTKPVSPPKGVICSPQQTADVVNDFIQIYADPYDSGPITTIGLLASFMEPITKRLNIQPIEYLHYTTNIIQKLVYYDGRMNANIKNNESWTTNKWFGETFQTLTNIFSQQPKNGIKSNSSTTSYASTNTIDLNSIIEEFIKMGVSLENFVTKNIDKLLANPNLLAGLGMCYTILNWNKIIQSGPISKEDAYIEFMQISDADFKKADQIIVKSATGIQNNILPAAFNLIANGLYKSNDLVEISTICTAVDISELELTGSSK